MPTHDDIGTGPDNVLTSEQNKGVTWTLWREIWGTFIGFSPVLIAILVWGSSVQRDIALHDIRLSVLESNRVIERAELLTRMDRLSAQIEQLQLQVARQDRISGRGERTDRFDR